MFNKPAHYFAVNIAVHITVLNAILIAVPIVGSLVYPRHIKQYI